MPCMIQRCVAAVIGSIITNAKMAITIHDILIPQTIDPESTDPADAPPK